MSNWTNLVLLIMLIAIGVINYRNSLKLEKKRFWVNIFNIAFLGIIYTLFINFVELNPYVYIIIRTIFIVFLLNFYLGYIDEKNLLSESLIYSLFINIFFLNLQTGYLSIFKSNSLSLELLPATVLSGMYIGYFYALGEKKKNISTVKKVTIRIFPFVIGVFLEFLQNLDVRRELNNWLFFSVSFVLFIVMFFHINKFEEDQLEIAKEPVDETLFLDEVEEEEEAKETKDLKKKNRYKLDDELDFDIISLERI